MSERKLGADGSCWLASALAKDPGLAASEAEIYQTKVANWSGGVLASEICFHREVLLPPSPPESPSRVRMLVAYALTLTACRG